MNATLETVDGRPALRFVRQLPHPVERVWRAISTPAELEQWFPAAVEWTPSPGEELEAYGMTGQVTLVEPPHKLEWTFNGDEYRFELNEEDGGSQLVFLHVFDDRASAAQTAAGWEAYFTRLEPLLEGGFMSEQEAHENWRAVHEHYAGKFDLDPAPGRAFAATLEGQSAEGGL